MHGIHPLSFSVAERMASVPWRAGIRPMKLARLIAGTRSGVGPDAGAGRRIPPVGAALYHLAMTRGRRGRACHVHGQSHRPGPPGPWAQVVLAARPVISYSYTWPAPVNLCRLADLQLAWFPAPTRRARIRSGRPA